MKEVKIFLCGTKVRDLSQWNKSNRKRREVDGKKTFQILKMEGNNISASVQHSIAQQRVEGHSVSFTVQNAASDYLVSIDLPVCYRSQAVRDNPRKIIL